MVSSPARLSRFRAWKAVPVPQAQAAAFVKVQTIGHLDAGVGGADQKVLVAAVGAGAVHGGTVQAHLSVTDATHGAGAAAGVVVHHDMVADGQLGDAGANLGDDCRRARGRRLSGWRGRRARLWERGSVADRCRTGRTPLIRITTSPGPGCGSGMVRISTSRSPVKTTPRMLTVPPVDFSWMHRIRQDFENTGPSPRPSPARGEGAPITWSMGR